MKPPGRVVVAAMLVAVAAAVLSAPLYRPELRRASTLQQAASPGRLSQAHAFLENDCAACHTAVKGPDATKCVACHASDEALLGREPTAFHAGVTSCRECHAEHRGRKARPSEMDHAAIASLGLRSLKDDRETRAAHDRLLSWIGREGRDHSGAGGEARITAAESALDCAACHETKDRHRGLFGRDCAECHGTARWAIGEFRHPSPRSSECACCHLPPPSHSMEHFRVVSQRVAKKPDARSDQCFRCHQTTAWNDIKEVGWYKHH